MFRQSIARTVPSFKSATVQSRGFAKATLVGRLGADPIEKTTQGDGGRSYWLYRLAVAKPAKKDAATGELIRDEAGNPVREADWFSVFNFRENGKEVMPNYHSGDLVLVEASLSNRTTAEGLTEHIFNHNSIKILNRADKKE